MKSLQLKITKMTPAVMASLEKRGLVRRLYPPRAAVATRTATGAVATFYRSAAAYGTHKLIAVGKRSVDIKLTVHPDNEDLILLNPARLKFKPLYIIIGLSGEAALLKKRKNGTLSAKDFVALEASFDHPATCVFTMLKGTPHCEVTRPGPGQHPVFFVTEPAMLPSRTVRLNGYTLTI